jgi:SnoaL-like polyketide cyclase
VRQLCTGLRAAFPDLHAEIQWQTVDSDTVTTYKTYDGTHHGEFLGIAPPAGEFTLTPSMSSASTTDNSPTTGASPTFWASISLSDH